MTFEIVFMAPDRNYSISCDSYMDDCLADYLLSDDLRDEFSDVISDAIGSFVPFPMGSFSTRDEIPKLRRLVYEAAYRYIDQFTKHLKVKILLEEKDFQQDENKSGILIERLNAILHSLIQEHEECEQEYVEVGSAAIDCLKLFLKGSKWQQGLLDKDGDLIINDGKTQEGEDDDKNDFIPIIWFGMSDEPPIPCWVIKPRAYSDNCIWNEDLTHYYYWKALFANRGEKIDCSDWNITEGGIYMTWMFTEGNMDTPNLEEILKECPYEL